MVSLPSLVTMQNSAMHFIYGCLANDIVEVALGQCQL